MSLRDKYLKILSGLVPAGALGVSMALGSAMPAAASAEPATAQPPSQGQRVAERLAAIRDAVSEIVPSDPSARPEQRLAFVNFRNGGFGIGVPGPFYGAPWGNGWNNWRNGWNNWGNWRNGWGNW
ncbi:MAG TPA: GrrA/OscA1 family cyclophane-containing rSAM-modified RiPP [Stellaceae bacterium]|nr:GrrA/OscA1 family cyclophane-containing rSAM-modified RiPP [Stellaceae bacterium]